MKLLFAEKKKTVIWSRNSNVSIRRNTSLNNQHKTFSFFLSKKIKQFKYDALIKNVKHSKQFDCIVIFPFLVFDIT